MVERSEDVYYLIKYLILNNMKIGKFNISRMWIIIIAIILIIIGYYVVKSFLKSPTEGYITEKITLGEVIQEVSETGSVRATENISLGFKTIGKVGKINVATGDDVKKGDILAELDTAQAYSQLQSARAALEEANTQYNKLINGLTKEDIKTYQDAVDSASHDLQSKYDDALNTLNDAYIKIYNAYTVVTSVHGSYFNSTDQEGIKVLDGKNNINDNMKNVKIYLDIADQTLAKSDIDSVLSRMLLALSNVYNDLKVIRDQCDSGTYYSSVSSTDKTSLDTQKGYINTALTNVTTAQNNVSSYKIALQKAEDNLSLKTAVPRTEDIDIYQAQVRQAQANVDLYESQLSDNYIRSPIDAKVTNINAKKGEVVSTSESVINLLSSEPFQIKVNIYEQDIINVKPDDSVKITLVAFPKEDFYGKVLSVDPAEKIVDNVVYYEVTVEFPDQPEGVRSGMTADIVIRTNKKDNVLRVPKNAVESIDGKDMVQVVKNGKINSTEIVTGLEGDNYVEIVSGLNEGDEIITGKK